MAATRTLHVRISGRVQGVGYRAWTERVATELELTGWVRNRIDGTVEAVFQGDEARVGEMLARCEQGPRSAAVERVEVIGEDDAGTFSTFEVRATA